jgi:hypothetical protein
MVKTFEQNGQKISNKLVKTFEQNGQKFKTKWTSLNAALV